MGSVANLSTVLRILVSVQHFAVAESDHVQLLDSRSTSDNNTHAYVSRKYAMVLCSVTENMMYTHTQLDCSLNMANMC